MGIELLLTMASDQNELITLMGNGLALRYFCILCFSLNLSKHSHSFLQLFAFWVTHEAKSTFWNLPFSLLLKACL